MTAGSKHDMTIEQEYAARFPQSQQLHREAAAHLPGGVTHMARAFEPFPIYVDRCVGPYKWDVDGNRYIDFWTGHGAMLLGHAHPAVVEAIQEQAARGTHAGGSTRREIEWAQLIMDMVPCAESVKFTSSGTEATLLALRAARAATGKSKVIKFEGHFHGWHDYVACGVVEPFDVPLSAGIPEAVQDTVILVPFNDPRGPERGAGRLGRHCRGDRRAGRLLRRRGAHQPGLPGPFAGRDGAPRRGADFR